MFTIALVSLLSFQATQPALTASVDPRVELLSIVFRLAGNPEYNMPNSASPYAEDVARYFGPFREHAVVQAAQRLRAKRGVSYDAVMSLALHLTAPPELKERVPFDAPPPRLDRRWQANEAREFLAQLRAFAAESRFAEFVAAHRALYEEAGARLTREVNRAQYLAWFDKFFGARPRARFYVYVGLLNGGGNYGVGIRFADGAEEITPVIGAWRFDADGMPMFDAAIEDTVAHEFCHSYTNAFVDAHAAALEKPGRQLYDTCATVMADQAYGDWKTMLYESLVRACTVRYMQASGGDARARRQREYEEGRGFVWTGELAELLGTYEREREKYATFDAFMPRVIAFFEAYAPKAAARAAQAPHVVRSTPDSGADDVDPQLALLTVAFDRPMQDQSWSVVGGGPHFPELAGKPSYDKERKVFSVAVRLKPDWSYEFWLNRGEYMAFRSAEGVPLAPVHVTFRTRAQ
jgi:hypothetical protein